MQINLKEIRQKTVSLERYIDSLEEPFRQKFLETTTNYHPQPEATEQLKKLTPNYTLLVFSAAWCKDCAKNIPILFLISEATGIEARVFGNLKKDPLSHTRKWRIPPSPPEVETFKIDKLPSIIIINEKGIEIGRIVENPKNKPTLEEELVHLIKEEPKP